MFKVIFTLLSAFFCLASCSALDKSQGFDAELSEFNYPFELKYYSLSSQRQDLKMAYGDFGDRASDKVVVLLHGKNFSGFYWNRIAKELAKKSYRVIVIDQIGFGKSSKPENYQYSFYQLAENTLELLDSLKVEKFRAVGHSMGGMLAVHLSHLSLKVERVTLINPIGLEDYLNYTEYKDPEFFYEIESNKTIAKLRNYQKKNYYDGQWSPAYERLIEPFKGWSQGPDYDLIAWNAALTYGPIFSEPIGHILTNSKLPIDLIIGTRDKTGPGRNWKKPGVSKELGNYKVLGKKLKTANPQNIKLIELSDLGHMPQFEDYKRFSGVFYPLF